MQQSIKNQCKMLTGSPVQNWPFFFLTNSHEEGDLKSSSLQHAGVDGAVLCLIIVALASCLALCQAHK